MQPPTELRPEGSASPALRLGRWQLQRSFRRNLHSEVPNRLHRWDKRREIHVRGRWQQREIHRLADVRTRHVSGSGSSRLHRVRDGNDIWVGLSEVHSDLRRRMDGRTQKVRQVRVRSRQHEITRQNYRDTRLPEGEMRGRELPRTSAGTSHHVWHVKIRAHRVYGHVLRG